MLAVAVYTFFVREAEPPTQAVGEKKESATPVAGAALKSNLEDRSLFRNGAHETIERERQTIEARIAERDRQSAEFAKSVDRKAEYDAIANRLKKERAHYLGFFASLGVRSETVDEVLSAVFDRDVKRLDVFLDRSLRKPSDGSYQTNREKAAEFTRKSMEEYKSIESDASARLVALLGAETAALFEKEEASMREKRRPSVARDD